ncbi:uncharacterized protein TRUGW13939_10647 [Talaromyces rugulosus]|uniref:Transcription factor RfeG n=1 Tax=Talaromyces rugulosus TaxID=121627 RepID=A0A7H8RBJ2_TALRU|nr:uncharacterized protein TRUGW13939_10647 [Talaromyces rugulosus]QKX63477.1 hypothetical protein TRUGW13939_10647 [Talaromyces rugulosus]
MAGRGYERPERHNEYFISGDGISREVIQADICRYLGNDALVKPGSHQGRQGYLIRAYRNLTSEMITDLKADSARWEQEVARRADMGYSRASYASSSIHEMRQQQQGGGGGGGPSPATFNPPPNQYMDPYPQQPQYGGGHQPPHYGTPAYTSSQSPGFPQNAYASPPQQGPYSGQNPPPISAPDSHPAYTYTGQPNYPFEGRNAAPRYPGPGYENESDYPNVTSGMGYPPVTTASGAPMETRYTPEAYPEQHRPGANRPQQNRDPHRRPR